MKRFTPSNFGARVKNFVSITWKTLQTKLGQLKRRRGHYGKFEASYVKEASKQNRQKRIRVPKRRGKNGVSCQLFMPLAKGHAGNFVTQEGRKGRFSMGVEGSRGDKLLSKQRQLK